MLVYGVKRSVPVNGGEGIFDVETNDARSWMCGCVGCQEATKSVGAVLTESILARACRVLDGRSINLGDSFADFPSWGAASA